MKKASAAIIVLLGMILSGYLYANHFQDNMDNGHGAGIQIPQQFEQYMGNMADSIRSGSQSGANEVPEDIRDRLADVFKNLEDFSFHFNDSALFGERFQKIFDAEFRQKFDHLRSEVFNERFFERLQESLEEFHNQDFRIELEKDFTEQLQEKLGEMRRRLEEMDQQMQEKKGRGRAI
jgi:BMFP domain-containing protein YqiC